MSSTSKPSSCRPAYNFSNEKYRGIAGTSSTSDYDSFAMSLQSELKQEVTRGNLEGVLAAVKNGAIIDDMFKPKEGFNALMLSCFKGHAHIVSYLLDNGANPSIENKELINPLMVACFGSNKDEDQVLQCVKLLIVKGVDVNAADEHGTTSLMHACKQSHFSVVNELIANGVDVNRQDSNGWTALFWAASVGNFALVKVLVKAGAKRKLKDNKQRMAFSVAASKKGKPMRDIALFLGPKKFVRQLKLDNHPFKFLEYDDKFDKEKDEFALFLTKLDGTPIDTQSGGKPGKLTFYELLTTTTTKLSELGMHPIHQKLTMCFVKAFHLRPWVDKSDVTETENFTYIDYAYHMYDSVGILKMLETSQIYLRQQYLLGKAVIDYGKLARMAKLHLAQMANLKKVTEDFMNFSDTFDKNVFVPSDMIMVKQSSSSSLSLPLIKIVACSSIFVCVVWKLKS